MIEGFINATVNAHDEQALFGILHGAYWGLSVSDLVRIASARSYSTSLTAILESETKLRELGVEHVGEAQNVLATIRSAREREVSEAPHRVLEYILKQSGFLEHVIAHDPLEGGRVVRRLYDEVEKMVLYDNKTTLREVSEVLKRYRAHRIALNAPYIAGNDIEGDYDMVSRVGLK